MIAADDPRHGTVAGYNRLNCREACCREALARYRRQWEIDNYLGRARIVPALGSRRRVQALAALGWTLEDVAAEMGVSSRSMWSVLKHETINTEKAERVKVVYDRLSMRLPPAGKYTTRRQNQAAREGWLPPLAWDDESLDDPNARPAGHRVTADHEPGCAKLVNNRKACDCELSVDLVVVERALSGIPVRASIAERRVIIARWQGSKNDLAKVLSANVWRDMRETG